MLKRILLKDERVNQEIREELKRFIETNENEDTTVQNLWDSKSSPEGEIHCKQASIQTLERTQIHKLTLHRNELEKKKANRSYTQEKKRVNKVSSRTQWNRDQKYCGTDKQNQ